MERQIIDRVAEIIGDRARGEVSAALPAFGGRTAAEMVADGQIPAVLRHLEALAEGGFA